MNQDQRALLLLAASALRSGRTEATAKILLADALDRIAGAGNALGIPVSRSEALHISEETLIRAERERVTVLEDAEGDDPRFDPEPENQFGGTTTLDPRFTPNSEECPECGGRGWYEKTGMAHDPRCDGSCSVGCPVPIQEQYQCALCGGRGEIEAEGRGKP